MKAMAHEVFSFPCNNAVCLTLCQSSVSADFTVHLLTFVHIKDHDERQRRHSTRYARSFDSVCMYVNPGRELPAVQTGGARLQYLARQVSGSCTAR